MSLLTSVQSKIEKRIFDRLGSSATLTPFTSQTMDKWGDPTETTGTAVSITIVPYNLIDAKNEYNPFGIMNKGDVVMAFKHDQDLNKKDKITFNSKSYIITEIEQFPMSNGNVLKLARLAGEF